MGPNILVCPTAISFWCRLIIVFFLLLFFLWVCCRLSFWPLLYFSLLLLLSFSSLLCFFFLFLFPFLFCFLFTLLLESLSLFFFGVELLEISPAWVDDSLLSLFLVSKEISSPSQESENSIKKAINVAFLLDDRHKDAIKFAFFVHDKFEN